MSSAIGCLQANESPPSGRACAYTAHSVWENTGLCVALRISVNMLINPVPRVHSCTARAPHPTPLVSQLRTTLTLGRVGPLRPAMLYGCTQELYFCFAATQVNSTIVHNCTIVLLPNIVVLLHSRAAGSSGALEFCQGCMLYTLGMIYMSESHHHVTPEVKHISDSRAPYHPQPHLHTVCYWGHSLTLGLRQRRIVRTPLLRPACRAQHRGILSRVWCGPVTSPPA